MQNLIFVQRENINEDDSIVFCFGEIDARCHLHKYADNLVDDVFNMVRHYFYAVDAATSGIKGQICIYFVPPAVRSEGLYNNPDYPYIGTDVERKNNVCCLNKTLQRFCEEFSYIFIDLTKDYADEEGFMRKELSDGGPHIKEIKPLITFLREAL
jgi:hypothetical protein